MKMEDMALLFLAGSLAGMVFIFGMLKLFDFCESLLEKEAIEREKEMPEKGGFSF